jgi:PAS domain S-box-containing protein
MKPDAMTGRNIRDLFPERIAEQHMQAIKKVIRDGEMIHRELSEPFPKGERWIDARVVPVRNKNGTIIAALGISHDITDRKKAEEALKQSEERYRTILEEIEEGYQEVDLSGNFTFFNESFRKIFGYSEDELLGSNFRRYAADEETADRVYRAYNQMYKTGNPLKRFEWDIITKDGTRRSIEFSASLLRDGEGHRRGFRGIVRDVTERKFVEEQYRTMANSAQTGVYIIQDGLLCFVNPYILAYSGYPEEELIGERILQFVHPDDRTMVREMARKMLAGVLTTPYEYRIVDKNNQVRWFMETVTPISYKGMSAVLGNTMDTTERKWVEEARRSSEQRLSDIIEFLPDATLVVNRDGKVIAWNRAIEEMTGIKAEDMLGKGDYKYALPFYGERRSILIDLALHPEPEREKSYTNIERKGDILFGEAYTPGLIGGKTHLSATASVLRNAKGEIVAAIVNVSGTFMV